MTSRLISGGGFFLAALFLSAVAGAQAELKWESTSQRFIYKAGQSAMRCEFAYTNTGAATVRITEIKSGCACCTAAHATRKVVAPGEKGSIVMRVDVAGKELPLAKPVLVMTDDGRIQPLLVHVDTAGGAPVKVPKRRK